MSHVIQESFTCNGIFRWDVFTAAMPRLIIMDIVAASGAYSINGKFAVNISVFTLDAR